MEVTLTKLDHFGRGITYVDSVITFVNNALPEEIVDIEIILSKKKYNVANVKKYIKTSNKRVEPICPYFSFCGGCDLMHMNYEDTLSYKKDKLQEILSKNIEELPKIEIIKSNNDLKYRNKISLKVKNGILGYYQKNSHDIVETRYCYVAKNAINNIISDIKSLNIKNGEITIRCNYNDELLIIIDTKDNINIDIENLKTKHKIVGIVLNNKLINGSDYFIEIIDNLFFKVSYDAFFQINGDINKTIFELLNSYIPKNSKVLDLCCGVGSLGLSVGANCESLLGVEIVPNAICNALINAKMNKINNAEFNLGDITKIVNKLNRNFDSIIVDPPRSGLEPKVIEKILEINPKQIIYISCDPMTLNRDLNLLKDSYEIDKVFLLDMFPYSHHLETFVCLKRKVKKR